jgi:ribosomal protein L7/L12
MKITFSDSDLNEIKKVAALENRTPANYVQTVILGKLGLLGPKRRKLFFMGFCQDMKINSIKTIRAITGLGLKEAKDFVEGPVNTEILTSMQNEEAIKILKSPDSYTYWEER